MKKFLAAILCCIYAVASSGATVNFHYCMGKFIEWDVTAVAPETCNNCGMNKEAKKACCNDKHATLQLKKDQLAAIVNDVPHNNFVYVHHQYPSPINSFFIINDDAVQLIHSPPLIQNIPSFILQCVFMI